MKRILIPLALVVGLVAAAATAFAGTSSSRGTSICCPECDCDLCPFH